MARSVARATARRVQRRQHWKEWASEGIETLNELGCSPGYVPPPLPSAGQRVCLERLTSQYRDMPGPSADDLFDAGALRTLCNKSACYNEERSDVVLYKPERVSWPPSGYSPVPVEQLLGADDVKWFSAWNSHMLRPAEEARRLVADSGVRPHVDPTFRNHPREYALFVKGLLERGQVKLIAAEETRSKVGIFFVKKKCGQQRIIIDTRVCNLCFRTPLEQSFQHQAPSHMSNARETPSCSFVRVTSRMLSMG